MLKRSQIFMLISLALSGAGLVVDRAFLGGGGSARAVAMVEGAVRSAGAAAVNRAISAEVAVPAGGADSSALVQSLAALGASVRQASPNAPGPALDAFALPASWRQDREDAQARAQAASADLARSAPKSVAARSLPRVSAIVRSASGWRATIGGRVVRVGQVVDGWRVTDIAERSTRLEKGGEVVELKLSE